MSNDNFYKNSLLLTLSNLSTGILKFVFSIILSKKLGAEGVGLYSLIMPIYDLFCCLLCGGMITAISKEASFYYNKNDYSNLNKTIHITIIFDLIWSIFIALLFFILAPFISNVIIKDSRTLYSLWAISPALVFVAISSIYKGYFFGTNNIKAPAIIDIFEKTIRVVVIISLINLLSLKSITTTVTATYIALSCGELISLTLLYIFYKSNKKKFHKNLKSESSPQLLFNVLAISLPLAINGFLTTGISTISTLLIPRRLVAAGIEYTKALGLIGKFSGMALTIVFFPMILIVSMSILLVPDISNSLTNKNYYKLEKRIKEIINISVLLGITSMLLCMCIPTELGRLFYSRSDLGNYIKFVSYSAPFTYLMTSTYSILNGMGKQKAVLINSIISAILELILFYILIGIPSINVYGYGITLIITSLVGLILNLLEIKKICSIKIYFSTIIIGSFLTILMHYILKIFNSIIPSSLFLFKNLIIIFVAFILFYFSITILNKAEE